jgi:hypothetical protein
LQEVADALAKVKSYKVTLNIYEGDATTPAYVSTIETVEPDKTHTVTSFAGQTIESIQIGDDTYTKLGDTWQKTSGLGEAAATPVDGSDVIDNFADSESAGINVTQKGEDTINGEATVVYELTSNDSSVLTIWVGKDDHLPRKSEVKSDSEHIEIIYSDYGKDFDIKAPL